MKKITLTVAEFLLLSKVHESEVLNDQAAEFIETNSAENIDGEIEMSLPTETFDDTVCAVEEYKNNLAEDNPDLPAVVALHEKLKSVEETAEEEPVAENQEEVAEESTTDDEVDDDDQSEEQQPG